MTIGHDLFGDIESTFSIGISYRLIQVLRDTGDTVAIAHIMGASGQLIHCAYIRVKRILTEITLIANGIE